MFLPGMPKPQQRFRLSLPGHFGCKPELAGGACAAVASLLKPENLQTDFNHGVPLHR